MTEIQNSKQLAFDHPPADLDNVIWNLPALLNRLVGMCGTGRQCDFYNQQGHAMMNRIIYRVNNLVLVICYFSPSRRL